MMSTRGGADTVLISVNEAKILRCLKKIHVTVFMKLLFNI